MKIYNKEKTHILENPDLDKGYLQSDKLVTKTIPAQKEIQEQFHYEYKYYVNGGADRIKVIDVEYQPAKPESYEFEDIQVYIPYTEKEYAEVRTAKLTQKLDETDYIDNKLTEAIVEYIVTEDKTKLIELRSKYAKELADRESWRKEINVLETQLKQLTNQA